jgi:hypothetical protein
MSDTRGSNEPEDGPTAPHPDREDPTRDVTASPWAPPSTAHSGPSPVDAPVYGASAAPSAAGPPPAFPPSAFPPPPPPYGRPEAAYGPLPPPGQPYPAYGAAPGSLGKPYGSTSGKATAVLVLGIAAIPCLFFCGAGFIAAIVALTLAPGANREIRDSGGALTGEGQVKAGRILSIVALVLGLLVVAGYAVFIAFAVRNGGSGFGQSGRYN